MNTLSLNKQDSDTDTDLELQEIKKSNEDNKIYEGDFLNSMFKLQKFFDTQNKIIKTSRSGSGGSLEKMKVCNFNIM